MPIAQHKRAPIATHVPKSSSGRFRIESPSLRAGESTALAAVCPHANPRACDTPFFAFVYMLDPGLGKRSLRKRLAGNSHELAATLHDDDAFNTAGIVKLTHPASHLYC